jgi:steroid 5-alpha reductase family enzyme
MTSETSVLLLTFGCSLAVITLIWLFGVTRWRHDLSLIDGYYGAAALLHGGITYAVWHEHTARGTLLAGVAGAWAIGLSQSMTRRWMAHRHEGGDPRYRDAAEKLHIEGRGFWWKSYFVLAGSQAVLVSLLYLPLQLAIMGPYHGFSLLDAVGLAAVVTGALFEVVGNRQLELYKLGKGPSAGTPVLDSGLWRWSRHPNFFGHFLVFVGFLLVAVRDPSLWWTALSPATIGIILRFGSGVRMTDKAMLARRSGVPEYHDYVRRTSPFLPHPPRRSATGARPASRGSIRRIVS